MDEAVDVLRRDLTAGSRSAGSRSAGPRSGSAIVGYTLGWLLGLAGAAEAAEELARAEEMLPDYCFPARLEEIDVLESAMAQRPQDARAPYYLGNLFYDRRRYDDAIRVWRRAAQLDPAFPTAHRNLGLAEFNVLGRRQEALACYHRAFAAAPSDARVLYELDQLRRRCDVAPVERVRLLEESRPLVGKRDDLTIEYATLLNVVGRHDEALAVIRSRRFHPWEGGEGLVSGQWVLANLRLGALALDAGDPGTAIGFGEAALTRPPNLGEGKDILAPENEVQCHLGLALRAAGRESEARRWLNLAATVQGVAQAAEGEPTYWQAQARRALGDEDGATDLLGHLLRSARRRAAEPQKIDYFATSLPTFLVFEDDLDRRHRVECHYIEALALAGLGDRSGAKQQLLQVLDLDVAHAGAVWHLGRFGFDQDRD